ncbi:MAG: hypothetical protein ACXADB_14855 [Candidatus Hermodarchaeia archaeon]|jgi:hypothetical protein
MKSLNKTAPFVLILVGLMFLSSCNGQNEKSSGLTASSNGAFHGSSIPYEGADVLVQAGNFWPKFQLVPSVSFPVVADIRMGAGAYGASTSWHGDPGVILAMNNFIDYGAWRVDTSVDEVEEPINWENNNEEEFPEEYDQFIDGFNDHGVAVDYMLHFWDKTGHANGEELSTPRFQTEEQIQDFLNYTRFVVSHYTGRVQYYSIWSEPDNCPGIKCIEPQDYINLVRRTVPVIHEEDPQAKVSIAPNVLFFAREYLSAILESDIMTMIDVIQWHGIYNVLPNEPFFGDYYYQYPAIIEGIRQTAAAHGFDGEYWATEITYCSEEFPQCQGLSQPWGIPETDKQAAKYSARTIVMHLGLDMGVSMWTWQPDMPELAPWAHPTASNLYKVLAGTQPLNLTVRIAPEPPNTMTNAFELPNGDMLFALWTHGEAIDEDPGVITTLTFPGLSDQQVIAIDVLYGFEQKLLIDVRPGNLIIRNLLVRDYPLLLYITTPSPGSPIAIALISGLIIGIIVIVVSVYFFRKRRDR